VNPDGSHDGVDVSILRSFAVKLGVKLEIRETPHFDDLLAAVARGEADVAAGGLSITPERQQVVDFTKPYFPVAIMVIARRGSGIAKLADLAGKRGAAVPGTTHAELMRGTALVNAH